MPLKTTPILLVLLLTFSSLQFTQAQSTQRSRNGVFAVTAGYAEQIASRIEDSRGFHLGVNLYKADAVRWSYDAQLSFNVIDGTSNRFTPISAIGVRYYLIGNENRTRVFVNALAGFALEVLQERGDTDTQPDLGYSAGVFVESTKFVLGLSLENPEVFILKFGLIF